jgi:hypothetical protein
MSDVPVYDAVQRIFSMSWVSNAAANKLGDRALFDQELFWKLSNYIAVSGTPPKDRFKPAKPSADMITRLGTWSLVWGPGVYVHNWIGEVSNVAFLAHTKLPDMDRPGTDRDLYVIAIAATNPLSWYDWLVEDADVAKTVAWTDFDPRSKPTHADPQDGQPFISAATATGLHDLCTKLVAPAWVGSNPSTTLLEAVERVADTLDTDGQAPLIVFAGHSLAGALAPSLALFCKQTLLADRPQAVRDAIAAYPTAGATPGNQAFAELYATLLSPRAYSGAVHTPYGYLNARLYNAVDVVPHAWALAAHTDWDNNPSPFMDQIKTIYNQDSKLVSDLVQGAEDHASKSGMAYYTLPGVRLPGTPPTTPPGDLFAFLKVLGQEHVEAYIGKPGTGPAEGMATGLILQDPLPEFDLPKDALETA